MTSWENKQRGRRECISINITNILELINFKYTKYDAGNRGECFKPTYLNQN